MTRCRVGKFSKKTIRRAWQNCGILIQNVLDNNKMQIIFVVLNSIKGERTTFNFVLLFNEHPVVHRHELSIYFRSTHVRVHTLPTFCSDVLLNKYVFTMDKKMYLVNSLSFFMVPDNNTNLIWVFAVSKLYAY